MNAPLLHVKRKGTIVYAPDPPVFLYLVSSLDRHPTLKERTDSERKRHLKVDLIPRVFNTYKAAARLHAGSISFNRDHSTGEIQEIYVARPRKFS